MPPHKPTVKKPETVVFNVRLTREAIAALHALGEKNERSAAAEARLAIRAHINGKKAA